MDKVTFRNDYYFHIKCNGCGNLTEVKPGDYTEIKSDCKCNEPKPKPKQRKRKVNENKVSETNK